MKTTLSIIVALFALSLTPRISPNRYAVQQYGASSVGSFQLEQAQAVQGCGFAFAINPSFWVSYPNADVDIIRADGSHEPVLAGDTNLHGMSDGDAVEFLQGIGRNGHTDPCFAGSWGYTYFTHCDQSDPPVTQVFNYGGSCAFEKYKASVVCHCSPPVNTHGELYPVNIIGCQE